MVPREVFGVGGEGRRAYMMNRTQFRPIEKEKRSPHGWGGKNASFFPYSNPHPPLPPKKKNPRREPENMIAPQIYIFLPPFSYAISFPPFCTFYRFYPPHFAAKSVAAAGRSDHNDNKYSPAKSEARGDNEIPFPNVQQHRNRNSEKNGRTWEMGCCWPELGLPGCMGMPMP